MESYRINTELGKDMYLPICLKQEYRFLEILSLKINQTGFYRNSSSNYGVLIGRVTANNGLGIPNAKVSVFLPKDEVQGQLEAELYPYTSPFDLNSDGKRYNLLPRTKENGKDECYIPVGDMPTKNELLDNEEYKSIYEKYYKYTAVTNESGDYMIMGMPVGTQLIHMDVDLSDIGQFSVKPYDLIAQGMDVNLFGSNTQFKASNNLEELVHVHSMNRSTFIRPFWGQEGENGINRMDFNIPVTLTPTALLVFGNYTDARRNATSKRCRPRRRQGRNCELTTSNGTIEVIRRIADNRNEIEFLQLNNFQIDEDGNAIVPIQLNLKRKVTDEFGNLIDSIDGSGVPTEAAIRMKVSLNEYIDGTRRRTAKYLVPNLYNDFTFGNDTSDENMYRVRFRQIYTVMNYIPRYQKNRNDRNENHTGFKRIGTCESNTSLPYNRISTNFNPLYTVICVFVNVISTIAGILDTIIGAIPALNLSIELPCFDGSGDPQNLPPDEWATCILMFLADELNVIDRKFYNDFIIGSLYHPKFKFKVRFKRRRDALYYKYCAFDCRQTGIPEPDDPNYINRCKDTFIVDDDEFDSTPTYFDENDATERINPSDGRGYVYEQNGEFFYVARHDVDANSAAAPLSLDVATTEKDKLMWATNFMPMGSILECNIYDEPRFFQRLVATSYQEDEFFNFLYDTSDFLDCIRPNGIQEDRIYRISQFGVDVFSADDDDVGAGEFYLDDEETDIRGYLCENFLIYNDVFNYDDSNVTVIVDDDGEAFDIVDDECQNCDTDKPIKNVSPYFHYWGVFKGKTSLDKLKNNYYGNCN